MSVAVIAPIWNLLHQRVLTMLYQFRMEMSFKFHACFGPNGLSRILQSVSADFAEIFDRSGEDSECDLDDGN